MPRGKPTNLAVGAVFGRLTVTGGPRSGGANHGRVYPCRCACGQTLEVRAWYLANQVVRSCSCLRRDTFRLMARAPKDPAHRKKISTAMKAKADQRKRLDAAEQPPARAREYVDKPARPLRPKREAVQALAAAFGLAVPGVKR